GRADRLAAGPGAGSVCARPVRVRCGAARAVRRIGAHARRGVRWACRFHRRAFRAGLAAAADRPGRVAAMTTTLQGPHRIACLSTEAVEVLYRLGAQDRIAGISGYTVHPPEARRDKPKISGFSTARMDRLLAVRPDLVIGFSDLQRPLLDDCAAQGLPVRWFDQRSVAGIHEMIAALGELVHEVDAAARLSAQLQRRQDVMAAAAARLPWHPRVYFEEWDEPMICGIGWVSEL